MTVAACSQSAADITDLWTKLDLPTPASPMMTTLYTLCGWMMVDAADGVGEPCNTSILSGHRGGLRWMRWDGILAGRVQKIKFS